MSHHDESHEGDSKELAHVEADPIADPGLPAHLPRPTDVDPAKERRAERQVASLFMISAVLSVVFVAAYVSLPVGQGEDGQDRTTYIGGFGLSHLLLGASLGFALLLIGIGAIQWSRKLMADTEMVEYRHSASSTDEDREEALAALAAGAEDSGIGRRPLIRNSLLASMGALLLPGVVLLRDLGPMPEDKLEKTVWKRGVRVVQDVTGTPIRPDQVELGQLINAQPSVFYEVDEEGEHLYHGVELLQEKAKAAIIVVRIEPDKITPGEGREDWGVDGILCYSKICTHVGCPISLYEQQTHHVLCPCHQSTFDLADSAKVVFGPAARPLPQLPLYVDEEGYLAARSDFTEPVGPSYWERG